MPLATISVEIFQKEKKLCGSGPIGVTTWKDFLISLKKWHYEIFRTSCRSTFTMSSHYTALLVGTLVWLNTGYGTEKQYYDALFKCMKHLSCFVGMSHCVTSILGISWKRWFPCTIPGKHSMVIICISSQTAQLIWPNSWANWLLTKIKRIENWRNLFKSPLKLIWYNVTLNIFITLDTLQRIKKNASEDKSVFSYSFLVNRFFSKLVVATLFIVGSCQLVE